MAVSVTYVTSVDSLCRGVVVRGLSLRCSLFSVHNSFLLSYAVLTPLCTACRRLLRSVAADSQNECDADLNIFGILTGNMPCTRDMLTIEDVLWNSSFLHAADMAKPMHTLLT